MQSMVLWERSTCNQDAVFNRYSRRYYDSRNRTYLNTPIEPVRSMILCALLNSAKLVLLFHISLPSGPLYACLSSLMPLILGFHMSSQNVPRGLDSNSPPRLQFMNSLISEDSTSRNEKRNAPAIEINSLLDVDDEGVAVQPPKKQLKVAISVLSKKHAMTSRNVVDISSLHTVEGRPVRQPCFMFPHWMRMFMPG